MFYTKKQDSSAGQWLPEFKFRDSSRGLSVVILTTKIKMQYTKVTNIMFYIPQLSMKLV